jgi:hypothetical protein
MNVAEKRKCYNAARRARRWAEANWHRFEVFDEDLEGMCGIASCILLQELEKEGIDAKIYEAECHAYVMYDGYIIDVTATQFGGPKIMFRRRKKEESYEWYAGKSFTSAKAFVKHQRAVGWPSGQTYMAALRS